MKTYEEHLSLHRLIDTQRPGGTCSGTVWAVICLLTELRALSGRREDWVCGGLYDGNSPVPIDGECCWVSVSERDRMSITLCPTGAG